jgi:hypothetical protein
MLWFCVVILSPSSLNRANNSQKMKRIMLIMLAGGLLILNSCTKTGPPGPQGAQGPQGPQGNANVIGSDPFNVTNWTYSTSENAYYASFSDPDITAADADRGIVEIFLKYSDGTWRNLPDIVGNSQFYFRYSAGGFEIYYGTVNGTTPSNPGGPWTFRTVIVDPSNKAAHPNTNWKNYNEAVAALRSTTAAAAQ